MIHLFLSQQKTLKSHPWLQKMRKLNTFVILNKVGFLERKQKRVLCVIDMDMTF